MNKRIKEKNEKIDRVGNYKKVKTIKKNMIILELKSTTAMNQPVVELNSIGAK